MKTSRNNSDCDRTRLLTHRREARPVLPLPIGSIGWGEGRGEGRPFNAFNCCRVLLVLGAIALAQSVGAATLTTDKPDYVPGQYVIFTGTGWQPGETVSIDISETSVDPVFWVGSVSAIA